VVVQNGVVVSKLAIIDEYLKRLQGYIPVSMEQFASDWGLQKITERSLQVMIEVMIDIAERILAQKGVAPQKTATETIKKLQDLGITRNVDAYTKMVRFRNLVVHQYASIKTDILYSILKNNLNDFRLFIDEIQKYEGI
jgi:uncharacterized protein YutE (UPF0331/DUF86 family)